MRRGYRITKSFDPLRGGFGAYIETRLILSFLTCSGSHALRAAQPLQALNPFTAPTVLPLGRLVVIGIDRRDEGYTASPSQSILFIQVPGPPTRRYVPSSLGLVASGRPLRGSSSLPPLTSRWEPVHRLAGPRRLIQLCREVLDSRPTESSMGGGSMRTGGGSITDRPTCQIVPICGGFVRYPSRYLSPFRATRSARNRAPL